MWRAGRRRPLKVLYRDGFGGSRKWFRQLHAAAGLNLSRREDGPGWNFAVLTRTSQYAYMQGWHRVDRVVQDYLEKTRGLRSGEALE